MPKVNKPKSKSLRCYKTPYIKQPCRKSCGPTALYNLIKWGSHNKFYKEPREFTFRKLYQMCDCKEPFGTFYQEFDNTLHQILKKTKLNMASFRMHDTVVLDDINKFLKKGGVMLVEFYWEDPTRDGEHYIMIDSVVTDRHLTKYNVINFDDQAELSDTEKLISTRQLKTVLMPHIHTPSKHDDPFDDIYPKVWLIDKN